LLPVMSPERDNMALPYLAEASHFWMIHLDPVSHAQHTPDLLSTVVLSTVAQVEIRAASQFSRNSHA
jgi:hypothetical protein